MSIWVKAVSTLLFYISVCVWELVKQKCERIINFVTMHENVCNFRFKKKDEILPFIDKPS